MRETEASLRLSERADDAQTMNSGNMFHNGYSLQRRKDCHAEVLVKGMENRHKMMMSLIRMRMESEVCGGNNGAAF